MDNLGLTLKKLEPQRKIKKKYILFLSSRQIELNFLWDYVLFCPINRITIATVYNSMTFVTSKQMLTM